MSKEISKIEFAYLVDSPVGRLCLGQSGDSLTRLSFSSEIPVGAEIRRTELIRSAEAQLNEYFSGIRRVFDLPIELHGTEFQKCVWQALCNIPFGDTRSYGELAAAVGSPSAARAVGMANHNNPIGIIVPCHRVIGANGSLTGYAGGLDKKRFLLELEFNNR